MSQFPKRPFNCPFKSCETLTSCCPKSLKRPYLGNRSSYRHAVWTSLFRKIPRFLWARSRHTDTTTSTQFNITQQTMTRLTQFWYQIVQKSFLHLLRSAFTNPIWFSEAVGLLSSCYFRKLSFSEVCRSVCLFFCLFVCLYVNTSCALSNLKSLLNFDPKKFVG